MTEQTYVLRTPEICNRVIRWLEQIGAGDFKKVWQLEIKPYSKRNSNNQKRTYFGWVGMIAKDTGHSDDEIDEMFRKKFLPPTVVELGGESIEVSASIAKLPTMAMSEYMDRVMAFCATDLGMALPQPNDGGEWKIREPA